MWTCPGGGPEQARPGGRQRPKATAAVLAVTPRGEHGQVDAEADDSVTIDAGIQRLIVRTPVPYRTPWPG